MEIVSGNLSHNDNHLVWFAVLILLPTLAAVILDFTVDYWFNMAKPTNPKDEED